MGCKDGIFDNDPDSGLRERTSESPDLRGVSLASQAWDLDQLNINHNPDNNLWRLWRFPQVIKETYTNRSKDYYDAHPCLFVVVDLISKVLSLST